MCSSVLTQSTGQREYLPEFMSGICSFNRNSLPGAIYVKMVRQLFGDSCLCHELTPEDAAHGPAFPACRARHPFGSHGCPFSLSNATHFLSVQHFAILFSCLDLSVPVISLLNSCPSRVNFSCHGVLWPYPAELFCSATLSVSISTRVCLIMKQNTV